MTYGELVVSFSKVRSLGTGPTQQEDVSGWIPPSHMAFHLRATVKSSDMTWFSYYR